MENTCRDKDTCWSCIFCHFYFSLIINSVYCFDIHFLFRRQNVQNSEAIVIYLLALTIWHLNLLPSNAVNKCRKMISTTNCLLITPLWCRCHRFKSCRLIITIKNNYNQSCLNGLTAFLVWCLTIFIVCLQKC